MKRDNHLLELIACPDNLRQAFWKAQKGKSGKQEVVSFRRSLDKNLLKIRQDILMGHVDVGHYHYFKIYDPKERNICAATFNERILHHALINICANNFEKFQIYDSYACRVGKGTYAALERAKIFQKRYKWFLKLDIRKYFDSIDHCVLKTLLQRRFKEKALLNIFHQIIDSYETSHEKGIPIGNLTSQYFANHYLAIADHYVKEILRASAYIRYMDDMVIWDNSSSQLFAIGKRLEEFLANDLSLTLKQFCLNRTGNGLPFLGYLVFPDKIKLKRKSKLRFKSKFTDYTNKLRYSEWNQDIYQQHILPLFAFVKHADTHGLRDSMIKKMELNIM